MFIIIPKAIAELAAKLNFDYVSVAYSSDSTSKELRNLLEKELRDHSVCVEDCVDVIHNSTDAELANDIVRNCTARAAIIIMMSRSHECN